MKQIDEGTLKQAVFILNEFVYNPHCETKIQEEVHSRGFCKTCADHYFLGQEVLAKLMELSK